MSNSLISSLKAVQDFQKGLGPLPHYATIRRLERKKPALIYVYRRLNEETDYPAPTKNEPNRTVKRPTIYHITLTYSGKIILQSEHNPPRTSPAWLLD